MKWQVDDSHTMNSSPFIHTFFKSLVYPDLSLGEVLVVLQVRENSALVDPVVIVRPEEKDWKIPDVVFQILDVGWNQPRVTDLSGPPSTEKSQSHLTLYHLASLFVVHVHVRSAFIYLFHFTCSCPA